MCANVNPVQEFLTETGHHCGARERLLDITSELGEVSKEVLKSTAYGKNELRVTQDLAEEVGDLLFSIHALVYELDLDPNKQLAAAIKKYRTRWRAKGDIGSGNT